MILEALPDRQTGLVHAVAPHHGRLKLDAQRAPARRTVAGSGGRICRLLIHGQRDAVVVNPIVRIAFPAPGQAGTRGGLFEPAVAKELGVQTALDAFVHELRELPVQQRTERPSTVAASISMTARAGAGACDAPTPVARISARATPMRDVRRRCPRRDRSSLTRVLRCAGAVGRVLLSDDDRGCLRDAGSSGDYGHPRWVVKNAKRRTRVRYDRPLGAPELEVPASRRPTRSWAPLR